MFMSLINDGNSPPEFSIQTQNQFQNVDVIEGKLLTLDFDGNGMTDFLAIRGGRVYFTKTESTNPFKSVERTTRDQAFEVAVGDINGDCLDDIVGVSHEKLFWISYSEEKFMETYFIDGMEPTHYLVHLQVTDMNGDGFADISGTLDGKFVWYENDGEDEPSFTKHTIDIVGFDFPPQFVDINGDGITDIITADIVSVHLFLSPDFEEQIITVNSHFIPTVRRPSSLITDFSVADMDGDGSADIRIVRADQIVILKLSCPASSSSSSSEIIIRSSASSIAAFCGDGIINNNEECDSGTFCSGDGFSCLTDSNCVDTSVCVFDDEPPAPPPNNSLQLHSARVQGDFLQMSYSKDFETCLHIWKKQENGFFGRFDMILNFMCTKGANKNVQIDMNTLREKLSPGQRIKLCHGNEGLSRCTNEYTVTGSSGAFRNFFKNLFAQTTLGQLTLHSLRHREPGTLTIVYSFDSPSRAPVNFQVQDSTGRWSSLMGITGGSISPGSNVSMGFGTGKKCYYPEFGTAMRMCHTGTTNCSNIARVQTVQKISPIPSYCEGSARSIASTQSVASVQSAPATLNPITLHRIEHQWSGDSLTIEYSFAAQSWEKIDVQFADSFGVWSNLMGIVGNSMQPGVHMQVGYGTGRQCYYPDFGTLMRLCYQGTQNCSNTVTVPVVQKLDPLPSWCEDESDQKAGRCGGLSDGKSCDSNADCASEINSCVYNPFADITCGDDCKRIPISSSSSSSSINSEVKLPNFSSSSSSSQCEVVDCVAPPFGCRYINPEFEDGCMQRCGQMVCETEDNSSSSTSTRVSISIQSSSAAISARSLLSVTLSTRSIGLSSYSSSSIDEDDEIIGNDDDDNFGSSSSLRQLPSCGNGKIEATEQCDSGVSACGPRRACDLNTCTCYPTRPLVTTCGDGDLDTGEQCDVGVVSCEFGRVCDLRICTCILVEVSDDNGDGDEDDGVFANNPSVESIIAMNSITETISAAASICGNGVLEPPEECDDQNRRDEDGCTSTCLLEIGICGDGIVQSLLGEQCEQSTHNQSLPYSCNNCRFLSLFCGDNKLDPGEECDAGARNSTSQDAPCRPDCGSPRCGDAILDSAESCDDGNRLNKDGCDRYCRNEGGTQIAFDNTDTSDTKVAGENIDASSPPFPTTPYDLRYGSFPQYPNFQQLPYQLPLAQLQPMIQAQGPVGDTGPAAVAVIGAGAAAGFSWIRRKRRK
jgi:cysteine-rich repeat protein